MGKAQYNTARPHSSLGYKTPAAYAGTLIAPKGVTLAEALTAAGWEKALCPSRARQAGAHEDRG